ncbi:hypothetical protein M8818_006390 [Zalaria obscura]|uniref:Uncharacterized protein n=1 Tax=Zalaria obscura TaxID=2024903 RepID=A0ACC3S7G8_9PEZI
MANEKLMLAALLEWVLWLLAFLYCLAKVFQKAETLSTRVLAVVIMVLFTAFRLIFLPIMVVTLPLPPQVVQYFPGGVVSVLQWFAFWSFSALLIVPWLFCVFQVVTHNVGRTKRIQTVLDEESAPKVVIVMPCYKEIPDILLRTVDSLVDCEYPPSCLHVFLSFDGDQQDDLYLNTIERLGVPLTLTEYPKSIDIIFRSTRITVSRFPHGGKRSCQKKTFKLIDKVYEEYLKRNDNLFVLFIDSDCILDKVCIQNFMYEMELKPGSKQNMLAMTGVITSTTEKNSLITLLQDMEYIHGQLLERSVESGCGAVTCLPGALTILRFSAFRKMAKYYFADKAEQCDDLFDYGKCHLGEDRWLTHLFMIGAKERYQIQMNTGAFCKTEAVQTFRSLLKQRRRWFLGFITNEACMLTDVRLWKRYPLLCLIRLAQNTIRTTALLFFIMVISLITTSQTISQLPVGFIGVSLGLNWLLMLYFGAKLGRYKIMLYPLMFVLNPFFNWIYMVYGIFTAGQRTWGGPRADAGTADITTTPQAAIEHAIATGDELNVVPESFKPAVEAITRKKSVKQKLLPSDSLEGQFSAAEPLPGGWYKQEEHHTKHPPDFVGYELSDPPTNRSSVDSFATSSSALDSAYLPRRVESIVDPDDASLYHRAQADQRPPGGAFYESPRIVQTAAPSGIASKHPVQEATRLVSDTQSPLEPRPHHRTASNIVPLSEAVAHWNPPTRPPSYTAEPQPAQSASEDTTLPSPAPAPAHKRYSHPPLPHRAGAGTGAGTGAARARPRTGRSPLARKSFTRTADEMGMADAVRQVEELELRERERGRDEELRSQAFK